MASTQNPTYLKVQDKNGNDIWIHGNEDLREWLDSQPAPRHQILPS